MAFFCFREGVQVNGFGIFLYLIYPGAYVDLNSEDLLKSNSIKQLRIYCAGVWHNFILCIFACCFIFSLPWLMLPFYSIEGALVTYQTEVILRLFKLLLMLFRHFLSNALKF